MPESEPLEGKELKKKKSVMGRIKSKISTTLGRKKSSVMDPSPTDKDLKTSSAGVAASADSGASTKAAVDASSEPESASPRDDDESEQQQQEEERADSLNTNKKEDAAPAEIEPFDAKFVDDDYEAYDNEDDVGTSGTDAMSEEKVKPRSPAPMAADLRPQQDGDDDSEDEEVFASDYPGAEVSKMMDGVAVAASDEFADNSPNEADENDDEKLEVFEEEEEERGNQHSSRESFHQLPHQEQGQEPETPSGPGSMDLVVVGLSPLKLSRGSAPLSSSPVKKQAMPSSEDYHSKSPATSPVGSPRKSLAPIPHHQSAEQEIEEPIKPARRGGIKVELQADEGSNNDGLERPVLKAAPQFSSSRAASSTTTKSERPAPAAGPSIVAHSPEKHQPLLSDFRFGSELGSPSGACSSAAEPLAKRRGALCTGASSPAAVSAKAVRKSFSLDQEQHLAMPSPTKKAMAMARFAGTSSRTTAGGDQQRETLQGIQGDKKRQSEYPPSPRKASISRRRPSSMMEAPILASAAFSIEDSASHDAEKQQQSSDANGDTAGDEGDEEESSAAAAGGATDFAFDAGAAITLEFGERVARLLGADPWGDRQDGFDAIQYIVKKADLANAKNRRELFCAAIAAVQGGVEDRVAPVMYCALECLRTVLKAFAPVLDRSFLKYPPTNEQLSALIKSMTLKLGDSNKRTQREVLQGLLRVAKQKRLKTLPHILLHLSAKEVTPRIQVDTLRQLVSSLGVDSKNGLSLGVVMQFAIPALKIADEKTRKAAVELIADLHMLNGQAVNAQLAGVKPEMLRVINRRVDELITQREKEKAQVQSANQAEEAAAEGSNAEDDLEKGAELVAVPVDESKKTVALIEAQLVQAAGVIGPVTWRKLESKTWSDRKEALVDIEKVMTEAKSDLRDAKPAFGSVIQLNFLAYCVTVHKCLGDSIAPVVNSAMDCLATLIKVFGPCVEWREESVRDVVLLTIMRLFGTMQKPNSRTNRAACRSILKFARLTNAHTLRYTLSCIFAKETDALVQMHLLRLLIPEFGFQSDGISAALVLAAVGSALVHSNEKVRKTAIDVALCTQRLVGKEYVLKKLKDVKPVTLKELEKNFVDCEVKKDGDRPQTVHASSSASSGDAGLPPVNFGGGENARRLLNSAPVGVGKLYCTPPADDDVFASVRRGSVLSNEEENFMDSILDGGLDL